MPTDKCENCGNSYSWNWEEAFDKFGFSDGDGQVMTAVVEYVLKQAEYQVESIQYGMHNLVINSIIKDDMEFMPNENNSIQIGYDCPREYLSKEIIELLDKELGY